MKRPLLKFLLHGIFLQRAARSQKEIPFSKSRDEKTTSEYADTGIFFLRDAPWILKIREQSSPCPLIPVSGSHRIPQTADL